LKKKNLSGILSCKKIEFDLDLNIFKKKIEKTINFFFTENQKKSFLERKKNGKKIFVFFLENQS